MNKVNIQYHEILRGINEMGYLYLDKSRNEQRKEISSAQMNLDTSYYFPAISTKKLYWKGVVTELLWFLRGTSDIRFLHKYNVHIWDKDHDNFHKTNKTTDKDYLGNIYGPVWRGFNLDYAYSKHGTDQIVNLLRGIVENPMNTRQIVSAWNPSDIEVGDLALPPCHWAFEILPRPLANWEKEEKFPGYEYCFALKWHQRSVDTFLGLPFNLASYALLGNIIEEITGMKFVNIIGDLSRVHIYNSHQEAVKEQLSRDPNSFELPRLEFSENFYKHLNVFKSKPITSESFDEFIENLEPDDFKLIDYKSYSAIKADMIPPNTEEHDESTDSNHLSSVTSGVSIQTKDNKEE